jgi:hypothetical protein
VILTALALAVSGCGDSDDDSASGDTVATDAAEASSTAVETTVEPTTPPTTEAPATTSTAVEAPEGTEAATTTEGPAGTDPPATEPPPAPAADDCLVGAWVVTQDEMNGFYDTVEANVEGLTLEIVGETLLTFTETDYLWEPDFDLTVAIAGIEGSGVAGGSITGTYTSDGGIITTTLTSSDMMMQIDIGGTVTDASEMGNGFMATVPINDAPYSCEGGVPVIDFETGDGTPRHPVTLTAAG